MSPQLSELYGSSPQDFPHSAGPGWYGSTVDLSFRKPVPLQDVHLKRFFKIYHDVCGLTPNPPPNLPLRVEPPPSSPEDAALAEELFLQEGGKVARSKSLWNRNQKSTDSKDYKLATATLARLVENGGRPGVARALVQKGGIMKLSSDPQKQAKQIADRHDLLIHATKLRRQWLVDYFATISPPERLAEAFAIVFKGGDLELVQILLERGASPDSLFHSVPNHVDMLDTNMLKLLLRSPTPVSSANRVKWLNAAVGQGKFDLAILLLQYGPGPTQEYLDCLHKAIESSHIQAFLIALRTMYDRGEIRFDSLLPHIVKREMPFPAKIIALEATLCMAHSKQAQVLRQQARTPSLLDKDASEALDLCSSSGQIALIEILRQPRFDTNVLSSTLTSAINACDIHLLDHLYPSDTPVRLPPEYFLSDLPNIRDRSTRQKLLSRIMKLQIRGPYLDKELVHTVVEKEYDAIGSLLEAGASVDFYNGEALKQAVHAQHVKSVRILLPRASKETKETVFRHTQATEKLPRRLFTRLFIESGVRGDVLHMAFKEAICESSASRDDELIKNFLEAGADYRRLTPTSLHGLINQGDVEALADILNRLTRAKMPPDRMSKFVSALLDYLMHLPRNPADHKPRYQMMKLFIKSSATGDCVLSAFDEFLGTDLQSDEELLVIFMSPTPQNRTAYYSAVMARMLSTINLDMLRRLVDNMGLHREVLALALQHAAGGALNHDSGTAERVRCLLARPECDGPMLEESLDFHVRTYTERRSSGQRWPMKTIEVLMSKGFAGTTWLTHTLMAIIQANKPDLLTMVLKAAQQAISKDTIDSVLMLACQQSPDHGVLTLKSLLEFGASQKGLDTGLVLSSETGNFQNCELLLEYAADVNFREGECLTSALRHHQYSAVELLLATGKANQASLAAVWSLLTAAACDIEANWKVACCRQTLRAGFQGRQVQEYFMSNLSCKNPDQQMITAILNESETLKQELLFLESQKSASLVGSSSVAERPLMLIAALAQVVAAGYEDLCRLILSRLPPTFGMPIDILKTATIKSTQILALLSERLPIIDKQRILDLCLIHAVAQADDPRICTYLLQQGASCEAESSHAISVATHRALATGKSDRAYLEALIASHPGQNSLKVAWEIALKYYTAETYSTHPGFGPLRSLNVLQTILSAGLSDLELFADCMYMLCSQPRSRANKCTNCDQNAPTGSEECCMFKRVSAKTILLAQSLLDHGLVADHNNGRYIVAAANAYHHEILDILLLRVEDVPANSSMWFSDRANCSVFLESASQSREQGEARSKSIRALVRYGVVFPALEDAFLAAVHESANNPEAYETAEMLLRSGVIDKAGTALQFLVDHAQPGGRQLISMLLEQENSDEVKLRAAHGLIASGLDEDSTNSLLLTALLDKSSQMRELSMVEKQTLLQATANANKNETLSLVLTCIPGYFPTNAKSEFLVWLLRSCAELTEDFLSVVLESFGAEEIANIEAGDDSPCLVQEAVTGRKLHLIPFLVDAGAVSMKEKKSMLHWLVKNTEGEDSELLRAARRLCNESTLDDGSLHLAVLSMREGLVNLLLEHGHDPNFGTPFEESSDVIRLPLNALCATVPAVAHGSDVEFAFKGIVNNLLLHGADIYGLMCGRSLLFNALDNQNCTVPLLEDVLECLRFSNELDQSLIENDTARPATEHEDGEYIEVGSSQGSEVSGGVGSAGPSTNTSKTQYMCPMDGCKITRQKKSNLRRHYMKMHPDPKPVFRANQIKTVKWVAAKETREDETRRRRSRHGRFVTETDVTKTSFYDFENETHHYSATMYLTHNVSAQPQLAQRTFTPETKAALLEFLRTQDLPDIYYALSGDQPDDAIGVPLELLLLSTECAICFERTTDINEVFGCLTETCTHAWTTVTCKDCLDGYMTSKMTVEHGAVETQITCWAEGCSEVLRHHELQRHSDTATFAAYDHAMMQQMIRAGEAFVRCSTADCPGGGWLDSPDVSYFQCSQCDQETCVSHQGPRNDHAGKPCPATPAGRLYAEEEAREEAERQAAIAARTAEEEEARRRAAAEAERLARERREGEAATTALLSQISKRCPKCKTAIEKNEGCDHMTCEFCLFFPFYSVPLSCFVWQGCFTDIYIYYR